MTDFANARVVKCHICGTPFCDREGRACDCWQCQNCMKWFSDHDMLGNSEEMLCLYCDDERYWAEMRNVGNLSE